MRSLNSVARRLVLVRKPEQIDPAADQHAQRFPPRTSSGWRAAGN